MRNDCKLVVEELEKVVSKLQMIIYNIKSPDMSDAEEDAFSYSVECTYPDHLYDHLMKLRELITTQPQNRFWKNLWSFYEVNRKLSDKQLKHIDLHHSKLNV